MSRWKLHDIAEEVGKFCVCVRETELSYIHTWPLDILHHGTDDKYLINSSERHSLCLMDRRCWGASIAIFLPTSTFPLTIKQLGSLSWRMIIIIIIIIISNHTVDHHAGEVRGVALLLATLSMHITLLLQIESLLWSTHTVTGDEASSNSTTSLPSLVASLQANMTCTVINANGIRVARSRETNKQLSIRQ